MKQFKPHKIGGYWHLVRRVPKRYAGIDHRNPVRLSTGIRIMDDPTGRAAKAAVDGINRSLEEYWEARLSGHPTAVAPFEEVRRLARRRGFEYRPVEELAATETQKRKWPGQYERAIKNMIALVGDKDIADLTRSDALELRKHWQDRIVAEGMNVSSANRDIGAMSKMIRTISDTNGLGLMNVFDRLRITGMVKGQRKPFDAAHVQKVLLAEGQFDELNDEARHLIYLIAETGLRPSEAANLTRETIRLDAPVPHIQVRPDGRILKAKSSLRDIPLVGVALEVMKLYPGGFPRYRDNADALSALVNKSMKDRGLRGPGQSLYSLRHCLPVGISTKP